MSEKQVEKVVKRFCGECWEKEFGYPPPDAFDANEYEQPTAHERKAVIRPEGESCDFCAAEATRKALRDAPPPPPPEKSLAELEAERGDPEPGPASPPTDPEPPTNPEPTVKAKKKGRAA